MPTWLIGPGGSLLRPLADLEVIMKLEMLLGRYLLSIRPRQHGILGARWTLQGGKVLLILLSPFLNLSVSAISSLLRCEARLRMKLGSGK